MHTIHNARTQLFATALNNLGVAAIGVELTRSRSGLMARRHSGPASSRGAYASSSEHRKQFGQRGGE
jgi:hypothetical protein